MLKNGSNNLRGSAFILFSALMYATLPILVKIAYAAGLGPSSTLLLRYLFSFIILGGFIKLFRQGRLLSLSPLVIVQGICLVGSGLFYFFALETLPAGIATVIFFSHPVIVAVLSLFVFKEKFVPRLFVGLALALGGISLISGLLGGEMALPGCGIAWALLACLCYALYSLIGQKTLANNGALSITATISLLAVLILTPVYHGELGFFLHLTGQQILVTLAMAVLNTLLAVLFFLKGVQKIGASRASLISTAEPVFCLLLAFIILGERLTPPELAGSVLVFASMLLAVYPRGGLSFNPEA
jgi:drug/metabolite transporter (DMT)-like permease